MALSGIISIRSAAPPSQLMSWHARCQTRPCPTLCPLPNSSVFRGLAAFGFLGRGGWLVNLVMGSRRAFLQESPCLSRHPDRTDEQINRSLEKGGVIALHLVAQE